MKQTRKTVITIFAAMVLSMASVGCGSNSDSENHLGGGSGAGIIGGVQNLGNGAYTITFNGTNVYDSGVKIEGTNYQTTGANGVNTLSIGNPVLPVGQTGTMVGQSMIYPGSQLQLIRQQGSVFGTSNISGVLTLSPSFSTTQGQIQSLQYLYLKAFPQGGGLAFQVSFCCTTNPFTGQLQWATAQ